MKRTKIVCTIGPASREPTMLEKLIKAGMDVARLNMSHAEQPEHAENIRRIRAAAEAVGKPVAVLVDLQGPKLRIGQMPDDGILIRREETVKLTTRPVVGERVEGRDVDVVIPVQYKDLPRDVEPGECILLNDGLMELRAVEATGDEVICEVVTGGMLTSNKGLNLPGTLISAPAITEKDWHDLDFALEQGADWVALSFVRDDEEVLRLKGRIAERTPEGSYPIQVIAKIEKPQALDYIDQIIAAADGIMVARGDLGVEIPTETVPMVQKRLIHLCNAAGKPVITATQMLDSMIRNPRPTRAEASDVANAILDGTDAVMLSGETANGQYPLEAVETMVRIATEVENAARFAPWHPPAHVDAMSGGDVTDAVAHATCETACDLRARAIITATTSGRTARAVCKYRPHAVIIAVTPTPIVQRQLMLCWGVTPLDSERVGNTDQLIDNAVRRAVDAGMVAEGERVVLTAGVAAYMPGTTNLMRVETVRVEDETGSS